jgi:DNA-directed RNA polymerase specialized sigma24 family protein
MAHRRGLDRLVHHTGAENGQISMKITSFHSNREGGASKPGIMVLTLREEDLEALPGEKPRPENATRSAEPAACDESLGLHREVAAFVAALPWEQRAALTLRRHHKRGYAEIAATLRCSECEARAIVYEVLRSLRVHVADRL